MNNPGPPFPGLAWVNRLGFGFISDSLHLIDLTCMRLNSLIYLFWKFLLANAASVVSMSF